MVTQWIVCFLRNVNRKEQIKNKKEYVQNHTHIKLGVIYLLSKNNDIFKYFYISSQSFNSKNFNESKSSNNVSRKGCASPPISIWAHGTGLE